MHTQPQQSQRRTALAREALQNLAVPHRPPGRPEQHNHCDSASVHSGPHNLCHRTAQAQGNKQQHPYSPVPREPKVAIQVRWLDPLVRHVVDGQHAAGILVHPVPPIFCGHKSWHQGCMPVVGHKQAVLSIGVAWGLARPAHNQVRFERKQANQLSASKLLPSSEAQKGISGG